jgi:hypothetical protein
MGLDQYQLREAFSDDGLRARLVAVHGLSRLMVLSILPDGYEPPPELADGIALTALGHKVLAEAPSLGFSEQVRTVAIFGIFGYSQLFVDIDKTDIEVVTSVMSKEISGGRVRYPYIYGRALYDAYFDSAPHGERDLSHELTWQLLQATGQGVCQVGNWVTGPRGILKAESNRLLPPMLQVPLAHCSDPACDALHPVTLRTGETPIGQAFSETFRWLHQTADESQSEWSAFLTWAIKGKKRWADFNASDLVVGLPNCFGASELHTLLAYLWRHKAFDPAAANLPQNISPEQASSMLLPNECLQALYLSTDESLCDAIDSLIADDSLRFEDGEVRVSPFHFSGASYWDQFAEFSKLGVRFKSARVELAPLRLRKMLLRISASPEAQEDLEWRLIEYEGSNLPERILRASQKGDIRDLVADVILSRKQGFDALCSYLQYGKLDPPTDPASRARLTEIALWKLGFEAPVTATLLSNFWHWLSELSGFLAQQTIATAQDQAEVRSLAVNLFVAFEEILETALCFATWAMMTDHTSLPTAARFSYNRRSAKQFASLVFDRTVLSDGTVLSFGADTGNNLFALSSGFGLLPRLLQSFDESEHRRPAAAMPEWAAYNTCQEFAFRHTIPWLDLEESSKTKLLATLGDIAAEFATGRVLEVRNRIPHPGEAFPSRDEWLVALEACRSIVGFLESSGLFPLLYRIAETRRDGHGRSAKTLRDYAGREITLYSPTPARIGRTAGDSALVIVRIATVRQVSQPLRFRVEHPSSFTDLWAGYPRRRGLPAFGDDDLLRDNISSTE